MEAQHELIDFPRDMKIRLFLQPLGSIPGHWHKSLELAFLIEGSVDVTMDGRNVTMKEGDVTLFNSNCIHSLSSRDGAVLVSIQIKPEMFGRGLNPDELEFDCVSATDPDPSRFNALRMCIARMCIENIERSDGLDYINYGMGYWLLGELMEWFRVPSPGKGPDRHKYIRRLSSIIDYIDTHYKENFSLADLAKSQGLSVPYLSSFFFKYTGMKFTQYCTDVKLSHAVNSLLTTEDTIEQVALANGFTESHTFIRAFKQKFKETPSAYRKKARELGERKTMADELREIHLDPAVYLDRLEQYNIGRRLNDGHFTSTEADLIRIQEIDLSGNAIPLRHTFRTLITVGCAHDLLRQDVSDMLADLVSQVRFRYLHFRGLLAEDMMVVSREQDGSVQFHFRMIDTVLEFLLSLRLKPVIQLGFMFQEGTMTDPSFSGAIHAPSGLLSSPPLQDLQEWKLLVQNLTRHLIFQFGEDEVASWPFTVCEESSPVSALFRRESALFRREEEYLELFVASYQAVKSVCPRISFGTPGNLYPCPATRWFFSRLRDTGCSPDFISLHYYADFETGDTTRQKTAKMSEHATRQKMTEESEIATRQETAEGPEIVTRQDADESKNAVSSSPLPLDPDDFSRFIKEAKEFFQEAGCGAVQLYLTEWNLNLSRQNLVSDTCFNSCYIMKNLLENYDALESFGYWTLTDLTRENTLPDSGNLFHGGPGIYTMSGVRKSVFYVFDFVNRLGNELVARGNGYFITRGKGGIQIITYHYVHYDSSFPAGTPSSPTKAERYAPFDMRRRVAISIPLTGLTPGEYILRERYVNRTYGSAYDIWVRMGGLPMSPSDSKQYANSCLPALHYDKVSCPMGCYTYSATLEPLEIRFAELIPNHSWE